MQSLSRTVFVAVFVVAITGCGPSGDDDGKGDGESNLFATVDVETCKSEKLWDAGDEGSPKMHPGSNCVDCHDDEDDAPELAIAGTVYADFTASEECAGVEGVEVVVTDETGESVRLETNAAGNFYLRADEMPLSTPLTAKVRHEGETRVMMGQVHNPNCSNCHTSERVGGRQPGRIVIPGVESD